MNFQQKEDFVEGMGNRGIVVMDSEFGMSLDLFLDLEMIYI